MAASLISGAFDAWLISSINYYGFNGDLKKIFGHKMWVSKAASATGSLVGACLGAYNLAWPWLGGGLILIVISIIAGVVMKEEYFVTTKHSGIVNRLKQIKGVAIDSVRYGLKEKMILLLMVLGITLNFSVQPLNMYWSVYFEGLLQHSKEYLGIIWFVMAIFTLGGGLFSSLILPRWVKKTSTAMLISYLIIVLGIIMSAILGPYWMVITFFMIHEIGRGMIDPVTKAYLHDQLPEQKRATVDSFQNMINRIGSAAGLWLFGTLAQNFGIPLSWFWAGIALLIITPLTIFIKEKRGQS
ncbi:MAG: MFS transporter [Patescibacteria group bacterium]|nr:MFS transporter [Patescibacteria group bacterium]